MNYKDYNSNIEITLLIKYGFDGRIYCYYIIGICNYTYLIGTFITASNDIFEIFIFFFIAKLILGF